MQAEWRQNEQVHPEDAHMHMHRRCQKLGQQTGAGLLLTEASCIGLLDGAMQNDLNIGSVCRIIALLY